VAPIGPRSFHVIRLSFEEHDSYELTARMIPDGLTQAHNCVEPDCAEADNTKTQTVMTHERERGGGT
jgi:hypothetical protein